MKKKIFSLVTALVLVFSFGTTVLGENVTGMSAIIDPPIFCDYEG